MIHFLLGQESYFFWRALLLVSGRVDYKLGMALEMDNGGYNPF